MNVGICDDEVYFLRDLENKISRYSLTSKVDINIRTYKTLDALLVDIDILDIVFLDIRFNGENLGIEWAKKLREQGIETLIIICSSLKDMVYKAFDAEPLRFLTKPVIEQELNNVLDVCIRKLTGISKLIVVKSDSGSAVVGIPQIIFIESQARIRSIHLADNKIIYTYEILKTLYEKINRPNQFMYPHKCYIVNLEKICKFEHGNLLMVNGTKIALANERASQFRMDFANYYMEDKNV